MDLSEIETEYKKRLEIAEKRFISEMKSRNLKERELSYKEDVKKIRYWYEERIKRIIKENKPKTIKKISKKEKIKIYRVNQENTDVGKIEKIKIALSNIKFIFSIKIKNFFNSIYYPHIAYHHKKIKYITNENYKYIKIVLIRINKRISKKIGIISDKIKNVIRVVKIIPLKAISLFKKQKKEEKKT